MKDILNSKYSRFFLAGLAFNILCAWFSIGHYHADEYFQVLEFCNYKMGHISAAGLPWEFHDKVRSALLPFIVYCDAKIMIGLGLYNPFTLAFLLRLFTGLVTWFITCRACLIFCSKLKNPVAERLLILMSMFLWMMPFLNVRFTPENISGMALLYGIYLVLRIKEKPSYSMLRYVVAGFLFGIAFFIRIQMAFAITGFLAWLIFIDKAKLKYISAIAISAIAAISINIFIDNWFYGGWTLTPINYYTANILQHKAAIYGQSPWWFYFTDFILNVIPPLSIILLTMFFAGVYKNLKDPLVWVIIPFILIHCFIGHKELRFLFPVVILFIYISALGFDYFLTKTFYKKTHKYVYAISLIICIPLLLYRTFSPAYTYVGYFRYLYNNAPVKNTILFNLHKDFDGSMYNLKSGFYGNDNLNTIAIDSTPQIKNYLLANQPESVLFLSKEGANFNMNVNGYKTEMVYCSYPSWVLKYNINHWEERSQIWGIYKFTKTR